MGWLIGFMVLAAIGGGVVAWVVAEGHRGREGDGDHTLETRTRSSVGRSADRATPSGRMATSLPARRPTRQFEMRWFGQDAELRVGDFLLEGPCVYASAGTPSGFRWATDPSEILVDAEVRRSPGPAGEMGYWPWYERIEPENRFEYLSWIASGRKKLPPREGYLFLYFYGIERRLLVEEQDRAWGLKEVVRLRKLDEPRAGTREGRSFRLYSTGLLWYEVARTPNLFDDKAFERVLGLTSHWTPDLLTAPLAWLAVRERSLPASMAQHIASNAPSAQRSVVTKRVPEEFAELFATRYRETFGVEGMKLRVSKRDAWHTYRPASGGLEEMRVRVPNPMGIPSQFKKLPFIWNSCVADLRKLSRVSASIEGDVLTVDAWEAMPDELRAAVDHPLTDSVAEILSSQTLPIEDENEEAGHDSAVLVPAGRLAELCGIDRRPTLTAAQSRKVAETLGDTGYGVVPDARITPIRYGWDDLVAVIQGATDDASLDSARYNAAACVLRLGLSIALADGEADEIELRMLTDHVDSVFDLSAEEQQRIAALRTLLLATGSDIRPIARKIQQMLPPDARKKVGRLLVVIAAASDGIDRSERAALRKAFRALDLPSDLLEDTIAEVAPEATESEVAVRSPSGDARHGEAIPVRNTSDGFQLNHAAISSIMAETREVSVMLAEAMGAADAESVEDEVDAVLPASASAEPARTDESLHVQFGPGGRYDAIFRALIEQASWTRADADRIAREQGLMLDAAIETINDWAYDALGAPLVEDDGDELLVERSLLEGE